MNKELKNSSLNKYNFLHRGYHFKSGWALQSLAHQAKLPQTTYSQNLEVPKVSVNSIFLLTLLKSVLRTFFFILCFNKETMLYR